MNRLIRAMRAIRVLALCGLFVWAFAGTAGAAATAVRLACLGEFESFPAWYAHERQWDAAEGIAVELKVLPTGRLLVDNMRALDWNLAACGGVPAMLAMLRKDVYAVGIGTDEAAANGIYARPGSPLFTADKAEAGRLMRGGMILCPLGTSAHQILLAWLEGLGLREDDVVIVDTKPEEALAAFLGGMGDAVALWSPAAYEARRRGLREVANGKDCGAALCRRASARGDRLPARLSAGCGRSGIHAGPGVRALVPAFSEGNGRAGDFRGGSACRAGRPHPVHG